MSIVVFGTSQIVRVLLPQKISGHHGARSAANIASARPANPLGATVKVCYHVNCFDSGLEDVRIYQVTFTIIGIGPSRVVHL